MSHGVAYLIDYAQRMNSQAHMPVRLEIQDLPDPTATYTMEQIMDYHPNAATFSKQVGFTLGFSSSRPQNQLVHSLLGIRGGLPLWEAELPFSPFTDAGRKCRAALVTLRKQVSAFLDDYRSPLLRMSDGNWQSPTRLPRSITL